MCAGNELFFCMLYLLHFTSGPICKYYYNNLFVSSSLMQTTLLKTPNTCVPQTGCVVENNHTHPSEGQMTILRGEGVLQGKSPKPYQNFQWCFFLWGGGGGGELVIWFAQEFFPKQLVVKRFPLTYKTIVRQAFLCKIFFARNQSSTYFYLRN